MTGLTPQGFVSKRLPEIKAQLEAEFRAAYGQELNLAPETIAGQLVGIQSERDSFLWAQLDDVYQSQYPSTASGVSLDRVVNLNGLTRLPARATTVTGILQLEPGAIVPAGRKARDGTRLYTLQDQVTADAGEAFGARIVVTEAADSQTYSVMIDSNVFSINSGAGASVASILTALASEIGAGAEVDGLALVVEYAGPLPISVSARLGIASLDMRGQFQADETGPQILPIGALNMIETPTIGWLGVTNRIAGTVGRARETDAELRVRREQSVRVNAINTLDGLTANIRQLPGVQDAIVRENSGTVTDSDGVPPQHIWAIVEGGAGADIAGEIFKRKAAGIGTFGAESAVTLASTGQSFTINYGRPTITPVFITVTIQASPRLPTRYIQNVREALVAAGSALGIGDPIIRNRLFTPCQRAVDRDSFVTSLLLDTVNPPTGEANLVAASDERFAILAENIFVLLA